MAGKGTLWCIFIYMFLFIHLMLSRDNHVPIGLWFLPTHIHQNVQWYLNSSSMKIKPYAWQYSIAFDLNNRANSRCIYFKMNLFQFTSFTFHNIILFTPKRYFLFATSVCFRRRWKVLCLSSNESFM